MAQQPRHTRTPVHSAQVLVLAYYGKVSESADSNETRLFFAPTARTLQRGAGYVSVYEFFLPFIGYGVTERVTLAGGVLPFFGAGAPVVGYVAPKVQVLVRDGMQAAVGGLAFVSTESEESVGIVYAVTSLGRSSDASVSLGAGFGYAGSDLANTPVLIAGWERRTSRASLLTVASRAVILCRNVFRLPLRSTHETRNCHRTAHSAPPRRSSIAALLPACDWPAPPGCVRLFADGEEGGIRWQHSPLCMGLGRRP